MPLLMLNMGSPTVPAYLEGLTALITKQTCKHYPNLKTLQKIFPCDVSKQPISGNLQQIISTNVHSKQTTIAAMKPYYDTVIRLRKPTQCRNEE